MSGAGQSGKTRRYIGAALRQAEQALTTRIASRVPADAAARIRALIARSADPGDEGGAGPGDDGALFGAFRPSSPAGRCRNSRRASTKNPDGGTLLPRYEEPVFRGRR